MGVPVYIITGFLDSGKTKFVSEMLADEGFSEGERTLLLCCEEGEEEYDPELLKKSNTVLVNLDEPDDMARFTALDKEYRPERILIEYNSTWLLETLYDAKKPEDWDLAQIIALVDANTFELYLKNMRNFMSDGLREADLIIFNRCTPETTKSPYRRTVLAMNNTARIFFENTDGSMDDGVSDEDLPLRTSPPRSSRSRTRSSARSIWTRSSTPTATTARPSTSRGARSGCAICRRSASCSAATP